MKTQTSIEMKPVKGILILIKRFFLGTPKAEIGMSIIEESNYLRKALKQQIRINNSLVIRLKLAEHDKIHT